MFITPIQKISDIGFPRETSNVSATPQVPLGSIFQDVLQSVIDTDKAVALDARALATGQTDDLHNLMINQTKAQISVQLLVQLRNRLMESYSEIMRINL